MSAEATAERPQISGPRRHTGKAHSYAPLMGAQTHWVMASVQLRPVNTPPGRPLARPRESHSWIVRYCESLLQLLPSMRVEAALQRAILAFPYCADLDPADAAHKYVVATHAGKQPPLSQALSYGLKRLRRG